MHEAETGQAFRCLFSAGVSSVAAPFIDAQVIRPRTPGAVTSMALRAGLARVAATPRFRGLSGDGSAYSTTPETRRGDGIWKCLGSRESASPLVDTLESNFGFRAFGTAPGSLPFPRRSTEEEAGLYLTEGEVFLLDNSASPFTRIDIPGQAVVCRLSPTGRKWR